MTRDDWRAVARDLAPLAQLLGPVVLVALVLGLNVTVNRDAYVREVDTYVAPVVTSTTAATDPAAGVAVTTTVEPPPPPPVTTTTSTTSTTTAPPTGDVWDRLAGCESSGRWHIFDSVHQGGLQFAVSTWDAYAPAGYPADAYLATRDQQIAVAIRVRDGVPGTSDPYLNPQGWGAWPHCSRVLGLRP